LPGIYFDKILYDELVADIVVDYELSGRKSLERLQNSLNHLEGDFSGIHIVNITTSKIKKYIDRRIEETASNATINRELAAFKRMLTIGSRSTPPKVHNIRLSPC